MKERPFLQRRTEEKTHETLPDKELSRWLTLGYPHVSRNHRPSTFIAKLGYPFFIFQIGSAELYSERDDLISISLENGM